MRDTLVAILIMLAFFIVSPIIAAIGGFLLGGVGFFGGLFAAIWFLNWVFFERPYN